MKTLLRNILAVPAGFVAGSAVNMSLILLGPILIPPPAGVDVMNSESLAAGIHLFEPRHFIFPFLAHFLGTLVGALVAWFVAASHRDVFAWIIGALSLAGGIAASVMIPAPAWYIALDLLAAYLPMAWLAIRLGRKFAGRAAA